MSESNELSPEEQAGIDAAAQGFGLAEPTEAEAPPPPALLPGGLTEEQYAQLLRGINPRRVNQFKKAGKSYAYVEAYEIRAHLIRLLGFLSYSEEITSMELIFDTEKDNRWSVAYRAACRLSINDAVYTEWAVGEAINQPSRADAHDLAVKKAQSQALKRCAYNLGDQFGLSLYNNGTTAPLVRATLVGGKPAEQAVDAHITAPLPAEEEPGQEQRETSSAKAPSATDAPEEPGSPMTTLRNLLAQRTNSPTERMGLVREARAFATEHGLLEQATATGGTIGAYLNAEMQKANAAIQAAAKGDGGEQGDAHNPRTVTE